MTDYQLWTLIINTLAAIGTVGAVVMSLWLTLRKSPAFKVGKIEVRSDRTLDKEYKVSKEENYLMVQFENMLDARMQIFSIFISYENTKENSNGTLGCGSGAYLKDNFIPPRSRYFVRVDLNRDEKPGTYKNAKRIKCEVSTSFGDKVVDFPHDWLPQLIEAKEEKEAVIELKKNKRGAC